MHGKPRIGFIGLGLMGSAMVGRLQDQGYELVVLANKNRIPIEQAVTRGAVEARTAREVAERSEIVMLCMDTSASVEARMRGPEGVIAGLSEGKTAIDFGTSLPASTIMLGGEVAAVGSTYIDAPLGRTPKHALDGLLNIMAAGDRQTFTKIKPVLEDLGENVFHVGELGAGHTLKLINNFFAMTTATAMSEAFAVADMSGLSRQTLYEVMAAGPLRSGMMDFVKAYAIDGEIELAFSVSNAGKDIGYYSKMVEDLGVASQMSISAKNALGLARTTGHGDKMVPQMVDWFHALYVEKFEQT